MCKSINQAADCNCDHCEPDGSMVEPVTAASLGYVQCAWCELHCQDIKPGEECSSCVTRKTVDSTFRGRTYRGLTAYVIWSSVGQGRKYKHWYTASHTVAQWKKQGLTGHVIAWFGGGAHGPVTALYLRDNGQLWRFWERTGQPIRATYLGTVEGSTFTPDAKLSLLTSEEYRANNRLATAAAISRACFG